MTANIHIIDDDLNICQMLERFLTRNGYKTTYSTDGHSGLQALEKQSADLVLCDFRLPDTDGKALLPKLKALNPAMQVIIITGYSDIKIAVDVMKMGAFDYVTKPLYPDEILIMIKRALSSSDKDTDSPSAGKENTKVIAAKPKQSAQTAYEKRFITGISKEAKEIQRQVELVAPTNYSVIIYGESGTGKESIAYSIHNLSSRSKGPFIAVDCGALTKDLAGSELFGHEKGAFTGALQTKIGQFEYANGGTIFLDEISNLSYDVQVSLLRVIQERKIRRLGSHKEIHVDVRIVVASNERLGDAASKGRFREDLFHRFNEFSIDLPPLRERNKDIMLFANFFLENANTELNKNIGSFHPDVEKIFMEYRWPGNLREMNNVIKRATLLSGKDIIMPETLPQEIVFQSKFSPPDENDAARALQNGNSDLKNAALNAEYEMILETLKKVNYNKSKAAKFLNIDRKTLYNKMRSFNITTN